MSMSTLVGYGSSDDGEEATEPDTKRLRVGEPNETSTANGHKDTPSRLARADQSLESASSAGQMIGPSTGPISELAAPNSTSVPQSPYSTKRNLIHNLTLPSVPNLDIPLSPPGSPPAGTDRKLEHFLNLKKEGIHFNEKLAGSSALKNPSLLEKLMGFAGLEGVAEYATTLPTAFWDPSAFPAWAYKEQLAKSQLEIHKKREEEQARPQRENIDFVSASASSQSSRTGTPGVTAVSKGMRVSAAERIMAGLSGDRIGSPQTSTLAARVNSNRKPGRWDDTEGRGRGRPSSPSRRKRSRSR